MTWKSPVVPWDLASDEHKARLTIAWSRGDLAWKLSPNQRVVYDAIRASHSMFKSSAQRWYVLDISRQFGKDFITALIVVETLLRARAAGRRGRFPYGAPTRHAVFELLVPTLEQLFVDCPPDLLPLELKDGTFRKSAVSLTFDTGQRVVLVGLDVAPDRMRGPKSLGFAVSEAGFVNDLDYVVEEVCLAQMLHVPDGFGILVSTPPRTPQHTWSTKWCAEAKRCGTYAHRTIFDNDMITKDQRDGYIEALGGLTAEKCRRELLAEHIPDETLVVVPEWPRVRGESDGFGGYTGGIVIEREPPAYRDCYVAMDPGISDLCAALFAYYDFTRDVLYIEDDFAIDRANTEVVASMVRDTEERRFKGVQAWNGNGMRDGVYKRVSDVDLRLVTDLNELHGLRFVTTRKDNRDAAINELRIRIQNKKIEIHPRCKTTIAHLDHAIWNKPRTQFERSGKFGHFDALAALVYLDRNVDRNRNPHPPPGWNNTDTRMVFPKTNRNSEFAEMFPAAIRRQEAKRKGLH